MTTEIAVSIISLAGSSLAAVLSWLQAQRAGKLNAGIKLAMAKMKEDVARRKQAVALAMTEAQPIEDAVERAWADIQISRDVIGKVTGPAHYDAHLAIKEIQPLAERLASAYAQFGS